MQTLTTQLLSAPHCTPLVQHGSVWLKPESMQRSGSVKYRLVYARIIEAIAAGAMNPQTTTLTELTAGSTGAALAYAGACLGIGVVLHVYGGGSPEMYARLRQGGADLLTHPQATPISTLLHRLHAQASTGVWHLNQYDRGKTIRAYRRFGEEIVQQFKTTGIRPRRLVCAVGTGGLLQGLGSYLRQVWPDLSVVAVEPEPGISIPGMRNTDVSHLGPQDPYDTGFPDERLIVPSPSQRVDIGGHTLGLSATAVYQAIQRRQDWQNSLMIAAD